MSDTKRTIGKDPSNTERMRRLKALHQAGYRGTISITAYFAADIYDITDHSIEYKGRKPYGHPGYIAPNMRTVYKQYITYDKQPFTLPMR